VQKTPAENKPMVAGTGCQSWLRPLRFVAIRFLLFRGWSSYQQGQTFAELADLHVATLASATPVDVISTDRHTVKPWFQGKIPFTFNLPELANTPFTLEGGTALLSGPGARRSADFQDWKSSDIGFHLPKSAGPRNLRQVTAARGATDVQRGNVE
jgi:hypothetical protein